MIANRLTTVNTKDIFVFLKDYFAGEKVDVVVVGLPVKLNNSPSEIQEEVKRFIASFKKQFPDIAVETVDERFTSSLAMQAMREGGVARMKRRNKALTDAVSATILLQDYLRARENKKNRERNV